MDGSTEAVARQGRNHVRADRPCAPCVTGDGTDVEGRGWNESAYPTWEEQQLRNIDRFEKILDHVGTLAQSVEELRRGMAALTEVAVAKVDLDDTLKDYALQNDLDSLRSEMLDRIAEATATPFDPERPA